jgi:hypothetical protein
MNEFHHNNNLNNTPTRTYCLRLNLTLNRVQNDVNFPYSVIKVDLSDYMISNIKRVEDYYYRISLNWDYDHITDILTLRYKDVHFSNYDIEITYFSNIKDEHIQKWGDSYKDSKINLICGYSDILPF